ncbi:ribosome small subunit-dependent GTPase A [Bacillus sp. HMF5848]|uniref:ribosome small subunit-dependent GTPase A n=1 Tax=Bacillus sp. HMF5848 TaxID=2495421 RepID=UPI000F782A02|nr:ribosome small subunit-dependent GTPase A [Bacillus sp. HMF5848]RSK27726.1 ribosome small subunit-dependent GTPase A [Bacillus sp. HMF5848]
MNLSKLGWNEELDACFNDSFSKGTYKPARVISQFQNIYKIYTENGVTLAKVAGKWRYGNNTLPAVGDWVVVTNHEGTSMVHSILPRKSCFERKAVGEETESQVIATNIDTVFIVSSLNHDFSPQRIERYLLLTWECGANPVIVLSKSDVCHDIADKMKQVERVAMGVPIHAISSVTGEGLAELETYMTEGHTVALLGSSGVGKSSLINALAGEHIQAVNTVREDDSKGRHTTTNRDLIVLENAVLIDTPGMREIQLWGSKDSLSQTFEDITELAQHCKFRDCNHKSEPGCAIKEALESGALPHDRWNSYVKMEKELAHLAKKQAELNRRLENRKKRA